MQNTRLSSSQSILEQQNYPNAKTILPLIG